MELELFDHEDGDKKRKKIVADFSVPIALLALP